MIRLFEWMYGANGFVPIDSYMVSVLRKYYCKVVFQTWLPNIPRQTLLLSIIVLNDIHFTQDSYYILIV